MGKTLRRPSDTKGVCVTFSCLKPWNMSHLLLGFLRKDALNQVIQENLWQA